MRNTWNNVKGKIMNFDEIIDTHVNIINTIVKTTDDIIPIIVTNPELDEPLKETIVQVFRFIEKILNLLPDLLNTVNKKVNYKYELNKSLNAIIEQLELLPKSPEKLTAVWFEFNYWW
jgi:hypothetical protein